MKTTVAPVLYVGMLCVSVSVAALACGDAAATADAPSASSRGGGGGGGGGGGTFGTADASAGASSSCVADQAKAQLTKIPVDIVVIVDTSPSMGPASNAVQANINDNLATVLMTSGIDYRVILLAGYGSGANVCIDPPLGGAPCASPPATPANTARFFHYGRSTGSGALLASIVDWYDQPDPYGLAPNGYSAWLRPGARKVFLAFSDTSSGSTLSAASFDAALRARSPALFGTAAARTYTFHSLVGLKQSSPATAPWLPEAPLVTGTCSGYSGLLGTAPEEQKVSILSGGWRFPICQFSSFDVVFKQIADDLVKVTPLSCAMPVPAPPAGRSLDPNTIQLDYHPGPGGPAETFRQVSDSSKCDQGSFYVDATTIHLCPQSCDHVKTDSTGAIDIRSGCDVGFVK